jgi:hypothetical protein
MRLAAPLPLLAIWLKLANQDADNLAGQECPARHSAAQSGPLRLPPHGLSSFSQAKSSNVLPVSSVGGNRHFLFG